MLIVPVVLWFNQVFFVFFVFFEIAFILPYCRSLLFLIIRLCGFVSPSEWIVLNSGIRPIIICFQLEKFPLTFINFFK